MRRSLPSAFVTSLILLALVLAATSATAAPVVTAPAAGATTTVRPTFSWTFEPLTTARALEVAATTTLDTAGDLTAPIIDVPLAPTARSLRPTLAQQLYAGRWYWHVTGTLGAGTAPAANSDSALRAFTVRKSIAAPYISINSTRRGTAGIVRVKVNVPAYTMRVRIVHGRTVCLSRVVRGTRPRTRLHRADSFKIFCYPVSPLATGTRATTTVTIIAGGVKRTTVHRDTVAEPRG